MKGLLIADIHGNHQALEKVLMLEHWDQIYCTGDLVDYGPSSKECIRSISEKTDLVVRGNHDNAVAFGVDCGCSYEIKDLSIKVREITKRDLLSQDIDYLKGLPVTMTASDKLLAHASPGDLFKYLRPDTPDKEFAVFDSHEEDVILLGHTHIPMDRTINGKRFVNPGSLGQPRDGDWRPSYCIIEDEEITFHRLDYDIDSVVEKMRGIGLPERAVRILKEGKIVP